MTAAGRLERVCLGVISGAHGVRGAVRLKSFTEVPEDLTAYGPLVDQAGGRSFRLTITGRGKGQLLGRIEGVEDRDQAEALAGTRLHVARADLPEINEPETFYHADLIGLLAEDRDGRPLGRVKAVHNFGAGDILELEGGAHDQGGGSPMVPFTRAVVPLVDLDGGRVVIEPPAEIVPGATAGEEEA